MATKNIVPNADSEGQLGTSSKFWSSAYLDGLNIGNDAAANLVFTPSANDTITLAAAANGAFTITTVDTAAAAANVGFVVDGAFDVDAAGAVTIDGVGVAVGSSGAASLITSGAASDIVVTTVHTAGMAFQLNANTNAASEVEINAGILDLNASGNITIDGADDITTTAVDNLSLATSSADGLLLISSAHTAGQAIHIDGNANAGSIVDIDAGILDIDVTAAATIDAVGVAIGAGSGELDLTTTGTMDVNSAALDIDTSGAITIDAAGVASDISISTAHTAGTAFLLDANANAGSIVQVDAGILDLNVTGATTLNGTTTTITSSSSDITTFATTNATSGYTEFAYNTSTVAGYIGNGTSLLSGAANTDFIMRSESGAIKFTTGGGNLALTIDSSQNATFASKSDITTSVSGFASTITNNKDDSQGVLIRTSDSDGGEYILDLQSSSTTTGTDYASKFRVAKGGDIAMPRAYNDTSFTAIYVDSTISSGASTYQGSLLLQAGGNGSASYGGSMVLYGHAHASLPGTALIGLSAVSGAKFTINNYGAGGGNELFKVERDNYNATVSLGNLVIGTAGKGIDFSATANGGVSTPSELLDDYEEGTWTPAFTGVNTSGTARGFYTKIGDTVHAHATITSISVSDGNQVIISLPFTRISYAGGAHNGGGSVGYTDLTVDELAVAPSNNAASVVLYKDTPSAAVTRTDMSGKRIDFSITYQTAT